MLSEFIHDKILPRLFRNNESDDDEDSTGGNDGVTGQSNDGGAGQSNDGETVNIPDYEGKLKEYLRPYGLTCVSPSTVYRWMIRLGFRYEPRRKRYYVDGHEKPATVEYRWAFCKRYLVYEQCMHRWIQVPEHVANELQGKGEVTKGSGYKYTSDDGLAMVEYHTDAVTRTSIKPEWITTNLGGNLSIRKPPNMKPLILFGHDECIFKQFTMPGKQWYGPNRETYIVPKDDGMGIMISAFQSREFGFGMPLTSNQLQQVNATRLGRKYKDERAAIDTRKDKEQGFKQPLTESPFVREFEYGANSEEGYWTYQHMVLQLEDCVDVLNVLFPQYDFLFLFDHSCGHDRQREDGLSVAKMSKYYGGAQRRPRDTTIKQAKGYLGSHSPVLKVGDVQSMCFTANDTGPWTKQSGRRNVMTKCLRGRRKLDSTQKTSW
jgi:hypothetical protein